MNDQCLILNSHHHHNNNTISKTNININISHKHECNTCKQPLEFTDHLRSSNFLLSSR